LDSIKLIFFFRVEKIKKNNNFLLKFAKGLFYFTDIYNVQMIGMF